MNSFIQEGSLDDDNAKDESVSKEMITKVYDMECMSRGKKRVSCIAFFAEMFKKTPRNVSKKRSLSI